MMRTCFVLFAASMVAGPLVAEDALRFGSVAIDPGQEARLPVLVRNAETIRGFSLAFSYDGRGLSVTRFAVNEQYLPADAVRYTGLTDVPSENYAVLGVLFMWDQPSPTSGFAATPEGEERCLGWIVFQSTTATQPAAYTILPRNNIGDPPVSNTFAVAGGRSVMPVLAAGTLEVRNHNVLRMRSTVARPGATAGIVVEVDHDQPLAGLQIAFTFDNRGLRLRDDVPDSPDACVRSVSYCGMPVEALVAPRTIEQFILRVENDMEPGRGWATCGMLFDYVPPYDDQVLPAGTAQGVLTAYFHVAAEAQAGASLPVTFVDGLGDPPVDNRVIVAIYTPEGRIKDAVSIAPVLQDAVVRIAGTDVLFRRGYVNADDRRNIADAVSVLAYLFSSASEPPCFAAADANDDGKVNIADAVRLLAYLFVPGGPALPPPSLDCDIDPTPDDLTCAHATYACGG